MGVMYEVMTSKNIKPIPNSNDAYDKLKIITDAAQAGTLRPWSGAVIELLEEYKLFERVNHTKVEVTLSFPTSRPNPSMGIGIRYLKNEGTYAEDFFLFEKGVSLTAYYRGRQETELPEYKDTHHAKPSIILQEILPEIHQRLDDIETQLSSQDIFSDINMEDVVTQSEFDTEIKRIASDYKQAVDSFAAARGDSSAVQAYSRALQPQFTKQRTEIRDRWFASERLFEMKLNQIKDTYKDEALKSAMTQRLKDVFGKK